MSRHAQQQNTNRNEAVTQRVSAGPEVTGESTCPHSLRQADLSSQLWLWDDLVLFPTLGHFLSPEFNITSVSIIFLVKSIWFSLCLEQWDSCCPKILVHFSVLTNIPWTLRILKDKDLSRFFKNWVFCCQRASVIISPKADWHRCVPSRTTRWCDIFTFYQHYDPEGTPVLSRDTDQLAILICYSGCLPYLLMIVWEGMESNSLYFA